MSIIKITSENAPEPVGLYPHARKVGGLVFLSGVDNLPFGGSFQLIFDRSASILNKLFDWI